MEAQDLPLDRISNLPPSIIHTILKLMPMRDAFRTSILAHNWRGQCLNISELKFDDALFQGSINEQLSVKLKLSCIIYPILLRHKGPIVNFSLCISQLTSCCEIDQIIIHLSSIATLKIFTLRIESGDDHKLLPAFFKLQQLMLLDLTHCEFQPPVTFNGFSRLLSLSFKFVSITAEVLLRFISNCPLLKNFFLISDPKHLLGSWNSGFAELFECLPSVEYICMNLYPFKCFATGGVIPQALPTALVHLKALQLCGLSFASENVLLSVLLLVTSSPNLEKLVIGILEKNPTEALTHNAMNFVDHPDYSYVTLDHLCEVGIGELTNMKVGMEFVKFILAKSPMLKKVCIRIDKQVDVHGELSIMKELMQYPRASARAKIIML